MVTNKRDKIIPRQVRKIKPTRRSVSGVYIFRSETAIQFESLLEKDFLVRKEFNISVLDVIPQPCKIPFIDRNGRAQTYTPDFLVYYKLGNADIDNYPRPELIEVKPEKHWRKNKDKWFPKWKAAYRYAKEQGWTFHIHDETRIRNQVLANITFLERYKQMIFPQEESKFILKSINKSGIVSLERILAKHFMGSYRAEGVRHVWHLLASRELDCNISLPLKETTELWVPIHD